MEAAVLLLFIAGLLVCVASGITVAAAMIWGLLLFSLYARKKGFSIRNIGVLLVSGMRRVVNVLAVMLLVGALTASWRMSGTVACIVYHAAGWIVPRYFILCAFLLCCGISFVVGSSFSTASTAGAICMLLGRAAGVAPLPLAGAVMAGSFFGDRCSPMSSSALLVAGITRTRIHDNVRTMLRTALVPFVLSCGFYLLMGTDVQMSSGSAMRVLERSFVLKWYAAIPAALTLLLCVLRVDVKITLAASTLAAALMSVTVQGMPVGEVLRGLLSGFHPENAELAALLSGGGVVSMMSVTVIVCLSSSFSGIFEKTGLLNGLEAKVQRLAARTTRETAFALLAVLNAMISCNQTLAALLTEQLTQKLAPDPKQRASWLEDTVIVIAPLIPWSIASSVPLSVLQSDARALLYASYLYLIPLWLIAKSLCKKRLPR